MRKLIWFTLGFGAACAFCAYLWIPRGLILPLLIVSALLFVGFRDLLKVKSGSLLLLGLCAGIFWFSRFQTNVLEPLYELDGMTLDASIRCSDYGEPTDYGVRTEGKILIEDKYYPVLLYLNETETVEPGAVFSGSFRFKITAPGGQKESSYHQGEGVFLLAYQTEEVEGTLESQNWKDFPAVIRQRIVEILNSCLPEGDSSFSRALLLGDTSGLDYAVLTNLTVSGIRHIVAVSGLHISVLFGLLTFISFRKRFLTALTAFPVLLLFAAMTGFTPSVSRACMMCGLMMLASLVNMEYDGPTALAFSGLVLLLINPLVIVSLSYQLSFASVAGIFLFTPGIQKWLRSCFSVQKANRNRYRLVTWFSLSASVTLGATVATLPLCALHFGAISLAAILTNFLVLWAVSGIFYGLIGMCLLYVIWPAGAGMLGQLLSMLIRFVLTTAKIIAGFPLSAVYTRSSYIVAWLVFIYVLLFAYLLLKNRKPATLVCCIVLTLCIALLASWSEPKLNDTRFTVLDVGQGQCLLFQSEGRTYMVDCGGSSEAMAADAAAETLLSQGISQLDGLILTHYDRDHAGGLENLLSRIDAKLLVLPPVYTDLQLEADQIVYAIEDLLVTSGGTQIHVFASNIGGNSNENSLCILFDTENCDILVTGDCGDFAERLLLRRINMPDVDILVAGHHGARDSTSEALLEKVQPEIVCISVGRNNRYGHPATELLQRLGRYGCTVYRTDLHGDIVIRR